MIHSKGLTIDEESALYLTSYFHQNKNLPAPYQVRSRQPSRSTSMSALSGKTICYRCGQLGHLAGQCTNELPDPAQIELEMNNDIQILISQLKETGDYESDEFGLYIKGDSNSVPVASDWKTASFCTNCGKPHPANRCPHKSYNEIINEMKNCLDSKSSFTAEQIKAFFYDIWD
ncbi:Zinc knuckle family protein [Tritrichomonas foetus]|uniref:Zinc knuckle family protein n=1 Tax=Tritrichomonas foetus TaxID=1144522 RepID=A0A1J4JTN1_9EUKA|nr:Zinc knuckle family protein [Tritrichomonas foetus]|eukprot:OHT02427.1 Zinc knuckle family protein [Tritrichomonas foetus]